MCQLFELPHSQDLQFQLVTVPSISMSEMAVMNPKCYKSANSREWDSDDVKRTTLLPADKRVVKRVCEMRN
jgi:hypothetical protein